MIVGAELRNLVNASALVAVLMDAIAARVHDFAEAIENITLGLALNILLNASDRQRTAYHEAGHALLALLVPGNDPVHRFSSVPRGMPLGVTYQLPVDDRTSYTEDDLRARVTGARGVDRRRSARDRRSVPARGDRVLAEHRDKL